MKRVVVDGLVWRLFDFDRSILGLLAAGPVVGRHSNEPGFAAEMEAMDVLEQALGTIVLHNDSSYCLRHGDITAVREMDGRRFPDLFEVKAGSSTAQRQRQAMIDRD